jgi:hypothetical protein
VEIGTEKQPLTGVDTVTLYLSPLHQAAILRLYTFASPQRIIFNPGAENPELATLAEANGIEPVEACTLVARNEFAGAVLITLVIIHLVAIPITGILSI